MVLRVCKAFWAGCVIALLTACGGSSGGASGASTGSGSGTSAPVNKAPILSGAPSAALEGVDFAFTPAASDPDGDALTFTSSKLPDWISFDAQTGSITGVPMAGDVGVHSGLEISVSDGKASTVLQFDLTVDADALEAALRTGDAKGLNSAAIVEAAIQDTLDKDSIKFDDALSEIFELNADGVVMADSLTDVSWDPTHDAGLLQSNFGFNTPILRSNAVTHSDYDVQDQALAVIGEHRIGADPAGRYMVMGSNPLRNLARGGRVSDDMQRFMQNSLSWLTGYSDLDSRAFNVVIAQSSESFYFPDQSANRDWLAANYSGVSFNDPQACDGGALAACLQAGVDLLVISQYMEDGQDAEQIARVVKAAMDSGTAVLYMHHDGNYGALAQALFPVFHVSYVGDNYWRRLQIVQVDAAQNIGVLPPFVSSVYDLVDRLKDDDFSFSLTECENRACPQESNYHAQFGDAAQYIRSLTRGLDSQGVRIFDSADYRFEKLLVLWGDIYRRDIIFPMDKTATPRAQFLTSYLADHIVYNNRNIAPAQADMGSFSRSDFSHVTPQSLAVNLIAKPDFRSTGTYAIPGQSFTVTRTDTSDVKTAIFINSVRDSASHEFDDDNYVRPRYPQSVHMAITPGQTLQLTSVYGGPIQISFSAKDVGVDLLFENIGRHAYWSGPDDDAAFSAAISANDYDWAELVTPAFEVHSLTSRMATSLEDEKWGSAAAIAEGANRYMSNLPHVLAGFQGPGIDVVDEIHDFAADNGLTLETLDKVKHMNAEIATCGYGCSGNPYDAYWSYDPLGHGDIHELGHGLERSRFRFTGWELHAVTNPYSYYSKSIYGRDTGEGLDAMSCQSLPFETIFDRVQQSQNEADPFAYMQAQSTGAWNQSVAMTIQFMMAAQDEGVLVDGWHVLARLHILDRAFNAADDNDASWLAVRDGLGFEGLTRDEARGLSNDDWLLIAYSHALGRDMRQLLTTWGMAHSELAGDLVASKNLPVMPVKFYMADNDNYCEGLDKSSVPIDGAQIWRP